MSTIPLHRYERIISFRGGIIQIRDVGDVGEAEITDSFARDRVAESPDRTLLTLNQIRQAGYTRVNILVYDRRPEVDHEPWDHLVECNLWMPTGSLEIDVVGESIYEWETLQPCDPVVPLGEAGMYRAIVCFGNLALTDQRLHAKEIDWMHAPSMPSREELNRLESVTVCFWPVAIRPLRILREYRQRS